MEIMDYLEEKGFEKSDYGTKGDPIIYWHHELCPDILHLEEERIFVFSLPEGLITEIKEITSKKDIDTLIDDLSKYKTCA